MCFNLLVFSRTSLNDFAVGSDKSTKAVHPLFRYTVLTLYYSFRACFCLCKGSTFMWMTGEVLRYYM